MNEEFLQFTWKYGLFDRAGLRTVNCEEVRVISLGEHNPNSGPDFLNARLQIGSTTWAGNVEIHIRSSDWFAHNHHLDKAYDNVILHVVQEFNLPVFRSNGQELTTLVLPLDAALYSNYSELVSYRARIPCHGRISAIDPLLVECWLNSLVVERLQNKSDYISGCLRENRGDWEEAFYAGLARAFGFGLNAVPFELLARSLPLAVIGRHRNEPLQVEALLMGQAGFLDEGLIFPQYYVTLRREYMHLQKKYRLRPIGKHLWKFLRLRPVNFPTVRISQFARLLCSTDGLFSHTTACIELEELREFFSLQANDFWNSHYTFEKTSVFTLKKLGPDAFNSLVINAMIPFLFIYGTMTAQEDLKEKALRWLNEIPAENNRIVRNWISAGIRPATAAYSQALLELALHYCDHRHCLRCQIGTKLITSGHK